MYIPRGVAQPEQLAVEIAEIERMLGTDVIRLRYVVRPNWSEEPAIYFKVILSDQASGRDRLHEVTSRVESLIQERLDPRNSWGLIAYYNFRSQAEQEMLQEPAWA